MSGRHAVPTARELAEAVREFLEDEVMPAVDGRLRFLARVAANASAQIERELALGPDLARAHARRLTALGMADDAELARAIRSGSLDDRLDEALAVTLASVVNKLRIANPRYLRPGDGET